MKNFPMRIKKLRGDLTLQAFSNKIGINLKTYQHYEAGTRKPSVAAILQIAAACGVSADWLLGLSGDPAAPAPTTAGPVSAVHGGACAACAVKDARIDKLLAIIDKLAQGGSASGSPSAHSETA